MHKPAILRDFAVVALTTAVAATGAVAIAPSASARSAYGCAWPRVCFYGDSDDASHRRNPTASYQDAGYWQTLGSRSRGAFAVYNSRNDDVALLRYELSGDQAFCVRPNEWVFLNPSEYPGAVRSVKVLSRSTCP